MPVRAATGNYIVIHRYIPSMGVAHVPIGVICLAVLRLNNSCALVCWWQKKQCLSDVAHPCFLQTVYYSSCFFGHCCHSIVLLYIQRVCNPQICRMFSSRGRSRHTVHQPEGRKNHPPHFRRSRPPTPCHAHAL